MTERMEIRMVTIIADEGNMKVGAKLHAAFSARGIDANEISLSDREVKPCVNCGGCTYQSFGRCVFHDDGDDIYSRVIRAEVLVFVTPIVFGGYSFRIKRVFDKFGLIMDRHYFIENKELVKGGRGRGKFKLCVVGLSDGCDEAEIRAFADLFHENLLITRGVGKVFFTEAAGFDDIKERIVSEVAKI